MQQQHTSQCVGILSKSNIAYIIKYNVCSTLKGKNTGMVKWRSVYLAAGGVGRCPKTCLHFGLQFGQFLHPGGADAVIQLRVGRDDVSPLSSMFDDAWSEKKQPKKKKQEHKFDRKSHSIFL